ncbi:hypothetical protein FGO68_gene4915 [Halteria grandinella]|uniref:C2 NT-type domain-containing protein n=1 Tax=Halteria grandinella TaxID=5974 RepID=A0A8J8P045_HALGN|nr:hypothetical protein FGO68_gene4915 [Halteria grandinella]
MTRYIQRLAKKVGSEDYRIHIKILSLHIPQTSPLFVEEQESLLGVYFKLKRGKTRMEGKKRFNIQSSAENGNTLIDEVFEYRSVFYKSQAQDHTFQPKKMSIKVKLESTKQGQKDRVLGKQNFDIARFVGKENVIYQITMEGGVAEATLNVSVVKYTGSKPAQMSGGAGVAQIGEEQHQDLIFNDSSEEEEVATKQEEEQEPEVDMETTKLICMRDGLLNVEQRLQLEVQKLEGVKENIESEFKIFKQLNEYNRNTKRQDVEKLKKAQAEKSKEVQALREKAELIKQIAALKVQ